MTDRHPQSDHQSAQYERNEDRIEGEGKDERHEKEHHDHCADFHHVHEFDAGGLAEVCLLNQSPVAAAKDRGSKRN